MLVALAVGAGFALVGPDLEAQVAIAGSGHKIPIIIALKEQFDAARLGVLVDGMPKRERQAEVARILQSWNADGQASLLAMLAGLEAGWQRRERRLALAGQRRVLQRDRGRHPAD
jgi:hypothetical protein